ncbi:hypothetical protein [Flavobacterium sp. W21_SRS_FM6]|uniref:hypothetical protein n=1 Tax=Flavobacterium sp. W21_SRS_FM6 TaxID=3240268 RepID=UPI003F8FD849
MLNTEDELTQFFMSFQRKLSGLSIEQCEPIIHQTLRLSDALFFTTMRWQLLNHNNELIMSWSSSYTLQKMDDDQLKIIVTVVDDENKQLEACLPTELKNE